MAYQLQSCDFQATAAKAKRMMDSELRWTINDCLEAAKCGDEFDKLGMPNNSGKYWDEYHTFCEELAKRQKGRKIRVGAMI